MDHNANISSYDYIASSYPIASFQEAQLVTDNAELGEGTTKCDETGDNQCYQSKTWTIPVDGLEHLSGDRMELFNMIKKLI